ncbi:hypothetical protein AZE42_08837 [Rhizopogon vesiculosus]|uniref:DUF6593 domain-containing protein n=1 Tax=Rhizopogon vesiculosus TaxID=180088 RepID=A0A1J8QSH5_9AGAM|nr:hypothetical protein AZE42_08837 [Rhizopogon vesiculosus]
MIVLTLSSEHVRNTVFTNEQRQVIYKISIPIFGDTTIHKIKPNANQFAMRDRFEIMGKIDYIPSHGFTGRKRVFTGPDGRSYRWDLDKRVVVVSALHFLF